MLDFVKGVLLIIQLEQDKQGVLLILQDATKQNI
jgi:hypothetical protein